MFTKKENRSNMPLSYTYGAVNGANCTQTLERLCFHTLPTLPFPCNAYKICCLLWFCTEIQYTAVVHATSRIAKLSYGKSANSECMYDCCALCMQFFSRPPNNWKLRQILKEYQQRTCAVFPTPFTYSSTKPVSAKCARSAVWHSCVPGICIITYPKFGCGDSEGINTIWHTKRHILYLTERLLCKTP